MREQITKMSNRINNIICFFGGFLFGVTYTDDKVRKEKDEEIDELSDLVYLIRQEARCHKCDRDVFDNDVKGLLTYEKK